MIRYNCLDLPTTANGKLFRARWRRRSPEITRVDFVVGLLQLSDGVKSLFQLANDGPAHSGRGDRDHLAA